MPGNDSANDHNRQQLFVHVRQVGSESAVEYKSSPHGQHTQSTASHAHIPSAPFVRGVNRRVRSFDAPSVWRAVCLTRDYVHIQTSCVAMEPREQNTQENHHFSHSISDFMQPVLWLQQQGLCEGNHLQWGRQPDMCARAADQACTFVVDSGMAHFFVAFRSSAAIQCRECVLFSML